MGEAVCHTLCLSVGQRRAQMLAARAHLQRRWPAQHSSGAAGLRHRPALLLILAILRLPQTTTAQPPRATARARRPRRCIRRGHTRLQRRCHLACRAHTRCCGPALLLRSYGRGRRGRLRPQRRHHRRVRRRGQAALGQQLQPAQRRRHGPRLGRRDGRQQRHVPGPRARARPAAHVRTRGRLRPGPSPRVL
jgi:hypothetical protein